MSRELQYLLDLVGNVENNDVESATKTLMHRKNKLMKAKMQLNAPKVNKPISLAEEEKTEPTEEEKKALEDAKKKYEDTKKTAEDDAAAAKTAQEAADEAKKTADADAAAAEAEEDEDKKAEL